MTLQARRETVILPPMVAPHRYSRLQACTITGAGVALTGLLDLATGPDVWLGPLYFVSIAASAWLLGWKEATAVGFACLAIASFVNGFSFFPFGSAALLANIAIRAAFILMFVYLIDNTRLSLEREWQLARTDPLTGIWNRQAFFELVSRPETSKGWAALIYIDLDGLKRLNDEFGHAAGDLGIQAFVKCTLAAIRSQDVFARIGGDEFTIFLPIPEEAAGIEVAGRLHEIMNDMAGGTYNLKCSIGALILPPEYRAIDQALRLADHLMYQSKQRGAGLTVSTLEPGLHASGTVCGGPDAAESMARLSLVAQWLSPAS